MRSDFLVWLGLMINELGKHPWNIAIEVKVIQYVSQSSVIYKLVYGDSVGLPLPGAIM